MDTRLLVAIFFIAGLSLGWLGKSWVDTTQIAPVLTEAGVSTKSADDVAFQEGSASRDFGEPNSTILRSTPSSVVSPNVPTGSTQRRQDLSGNNFGADAFTRLLGSQRYADAMVVYQEALQTDDNQARQLRKQLLDELNQLLKSDRRGDFSALADYYLSIQYDDIDALLLLADFNSKSSSYLEVIDVYLLAKTYAYSDADQSKVDNRFNAFVNEIDRFYTQQQDWWSLINVYSHIQTTGLMNSTYQYLQATAYLRAGDEAFAVAQYQQLLGDSLVGESARSALSNLHAGNETSAPGNSEPASPTGLLASSRSLDDNTDAIALEKRGNQYLAELSNNQQSVVKLLIDTGASMTALTSNAFTELNANGDAVQQESRLFNTAGGVILGNVYLFPELRLGPYVLKNTQVAVIDLDRDQSFGGLLGMNILGQFRFQIDQENARLLLSTE